MAAGTTITHQLKPHCLGFPELLANAVALISPTMTAALIIPVMYGNTGDWSWLSYALGTVMLLFVAFNLNQFARRSASSGSMYAYICRGLGADGGRRRRLGPDLGLSRNRHGGRHRVHDLLRFAPVDDGHHGATTSSVRGLRWCRLVLCMEERSALRDHDVGL